MRLWTLGFITSQNMFISLFVIKYCAACTIGNWFPPLNVFLFVCIVDLIFSTKHSFKKEMRIESRFIYTNSE